MRVASLALALSALACAPGDARAGLGPEAPSPVTQLVVSPAIVAVGSNDVLDYSVSAIHEDGTASAEQVTWTATGGTITAGGIYTAGPTAGTFLVIATLQGATLADTVMVTITAAVLQAVVLTPPSASLSTGATQQFSVSGQWSNGTTTAPAVTYSATGGAITTGGLYTAGSTAGTFRVIAIQQGGTLADTAVVTLTAPGTGPYPNRPASFTHSREIDFSQAIPPNPGTDRPIAGVDWGMIYDDADGGGSNYSLIVDSTAPQSPTGVWKVRFPAGPHGGGVVGAGSGWGAGNFFTQSILPGSPAAVYVSIWHKVDPGFIWHPISNKFLYLSPGQILVELNEDGNWLASDNLNAGQWLNPNGTLNGAVLLTYKNDPISTGVWHHYEVLIDKTARTWKVWMDGDLKISANNLTFQEPYFESVELTAFRGGGGETLVRDVFWYYDHAYVAWP